MNFTLGTVDDGEYTASLATKTVRFVFTVYLCIAYDS